MPSHRTQIVPRYPQGYRTLPRNSMMRPESICSVAGSVYDRALHPASTSAVSTTEKRKSMRDDTMWQLYEWQQRQAFSRQSLAQPAGTLLQITSISFLKLYKWDLCLFYIRTLCFFFLILFLVVPIRLDTDGLQQTMTDSNHQRGCGCGVVRRPD